MLLVRPATRRGPALFQILPATVSDFQDLAYLRDQAAAWLNGLGFTDQWQKPWPSPQGERQRTLASIEKGEAWIVRDGPLAIATFALDAFADPRLWTESEQAERALYIHRLTVNRDYAGIGLGARIMNLIEAWAAAHGYSWLRVDVWTTNTQLHDYYHRLKFVQVRIVSGDYPSGALFQRKVPGQ
jgi:GNAT superfamily N-acetyltransferase